MADVLFQIVRVVFIVGFTIVLAGLIVLRFKELNRVYSGDTAPPETKTNCPACGARIPADTDVCTYCEESLTDDASDYGWIDD